MRGLIKQQISSPFPLPHRDIWMWVPDCKAVVLVPPGAPIYSNCFGFDPSSITKHPRALRALQLRLLPRRLLPSSPNALVSSVLGVRAPTSRQHPLETPREHRGRPPSAAEPLCREATRPTPPLRPGVLQGAWVGFGF